MNETLSLSIFCEGKSEPFQIHMTEMRLVGDCSTYNLGCVHGNFSDISRDELRAALSCLYSYDDDRHVKIVGTYETSVGSTREFFNILGGERLDIPGWLGSENFQMRVATLPLFEQLEEDETGYFSSIKVQRNGQADFEYP